MSITLPTEFDKGCFCAWLSVAIAQNRKLTRQDTNMLFIGALAHDIGMLHLSPELLKEYKKYSPEEWKKMQNHTLIGCEISKLTPLLPTAVSEIILYHHETCDGTGYFGKQQSELHRYSLIIALIDNLFAVRFKQKQNEGKSLLDLMPFLQANQYIFGYENYASLARVIKTLKTTRAC